MVAGSRSGAFTIPCDVRPGIAPLQPVACGNPGFQRGAAEGYARAEPGGLASLCHDVDDGPIHPPAYAPGGAQSRCLCGYFGKVPLQQDDGWIPGSVGCCRAPVLAMGAHYPGPVHADADYIPGVDDQKYQLVRVG